MITFVNPPVSLWERYKKLAGAGSIMPPLGLCYLASAVRKAGFNTKIIDAVALRLCAEEVVKRVMADSPRFVGLTATTPTIGSAAAVAQAVKNHNKDIITIVGGPHISSVGLETMKRYPQFDIGVIGEGEQTIIELLNVLKENRVASGVDGLIMRSGGDIRMTAPRAFIDDLDRLPLPAWELLPPLNKYYEPPGDNVTRYPNTSIIISRGCPKRCTFCDRSVFGNRYRSHSPSYIINMIRLLYDKYRIRDLAIWDDNFMANRQTVTGVCEELKRSGLDLIWSAQGTVDCAEPGLLKVMKEAGCWQIGWGLESGSQGILDFYQKRITINQSRRAIELAKEAGIRNRGYFMAANFIENKETMEQTINFIKELDLDEFEMSCLIPFPGAGIYRIADKYGTFDKEWGKMDPYTPSFIPNGLTREDVERFHKMAFRVVYFRPRIIWHFLKKVFNLRQWRLGLKILKSGLAVLRFSLSRDYGDDKDRDNRLTLPRREKVIVTSADDPVKCYYDWELRYVYRKRLKMAKQLLNGKRFNNLLEVGYGSGLFLPELSKYTGHLYGVDIHKKEEEVKKNLKEEFVEADLSYGDVVDLPFEDGKFDCLVCISVLEFIPDIWRAINETYRVIKKGGYFICGGPVLNRITDFSYSMVGFRDHKIRHKSNHQDIIFTIKSRFKIEKIINLPYFLPLRHSLFFCMRSVKE